MRCLSFRFCILYLPANHIPSNPIRLPIEVYLLLVLFIPISFAFPPMSSHFSHPTFFIHFYFCVFAIILWFSLLQSSSLNSHCLVACVSERMWWCLLLSLLTSAAAALAVKLAYNECISVSMPLYMIFAS